jgi:protein farnesyltransferase subunit beta
VPYPSNAHPSATLDEQADTERAISELLLTTAPPALPGVAGKSVFSGTGNGASAGANATAGGEHSGTVLRKMEHMQFFQSLFFKMPPPYVSLDASRPWLMYWTVHSWDLLGIALDQGTKDRYVIPLF